MRIGVDGNEANVSQRVGTSVYTYELLNYFSKKASKNLQFVIFLREKPVHNLPSESQHFSYRVVWGPFFWRDLFFPLILYLKLDCIDKLFCPAHYAPRYCPVPFVVTIHDLSHVFFKDEFLKMDLYKLTHWTRNAINRAQNIIAVSYNTQKDLIKTYAVSENKVDVIYNGFNYPNRSTQARKHIKNLSSEKYILFVSTLQPRKNISTLLYAFSKTIKKHNTIKLIITGKRGWLFDEIFKLVQTLKLTNRVIFTDYVNENELSFLYRHALIFVHPSLYEGFGMPILEAMASGCPVICSNTSSLPEIGGDAPLYFSPNNKIELAKALESVINDASLRKKMIQKGKRRTQLFSWNKCTRETLHTILHSHTK